MVRNFTIVSDIDDTIECLLDAWCDWLDKEYGLNVQPHQVKDWGMDLAFPTLSDEQIYEPLNLEEFWETVKPRKDAMIYLEKLYNEGYNIYLCTSTHYKNVAMKYEIIIKRYFPYVDWDHVIIAKDKHMIKCDYIIDDGVHNLIDCKNCIKILMTAPYNESFDAEKNCIHRVDNWAQIYDIIKTCY